MVAVRERDLVKVAWLEFLVTAQTESGDGELIPEFVEVPAWFKNYELGFAVGQGTNLVITLTHLEQINRANRATFEVVQRREDASPPSKKRSRDEEFKRETFKAMESERRHRRHRRKQRRQA
jgi:hypothetical protein